MAKKSETAKPKAAAKKAAAKKVAAQPVEKAPKVPKVPKVPKIKDIQNGVTRPSAETVSGQVWAIADSLSKKTKAPAKRADVLAETNAVGVNVATANTQFGHWCKYNNVNRKAATV